MVVSMSVKAFLGGESDSMAQACHRDQSIHIEITCVKRNTSTALLHNGFTVSSCYYQIVFAIHIKHSWVWPSADVKPMSHDHVNAML